MQVWNADQLRRFLAAIEAHQLYPAFYLKANTGMRRGEVLGLTWRNIDLETARISVTQAVLAPEYQVTVSDVKTPYSRRTIDLDPRTVAVRSSSSRSSRAAEATVHRPPRRRYIMESERVEGARALGVGTRLPGYGHRRCGWRSCRGRHRGSRRRCVLLRWPR